MLPQNPSLERWTRFGRPEHQSSHWTIALSDRWFGLTLLAFTLFHGVVAALLPLCEDEIYYVAWAKALSPSYYDHPAMTAVMIRLGTALFGYTPFGVRFAAVLSSTFIVWLLSRLTPSRNVLSLALFTPLFLWGSILITPDTPLLLAWSLYFFWAHRTVCCFSNWSDDPVSRVYRPTPLSQAHWLAGGLILGFGLNAKYTMALAPLCLVLALVSYRFSAWWKGFLLHGLIATALFAPVILFNIQYDFAPLLFQWLHGTASDTAPFRFLGDFLLGQVLLVGLVPFWVLLWQLFRATELKNFPDQRLSAIFFAVPFMLFLSHATRIKVEANWTFVAYLSLWILTQKLLNHASFHLESRVALWLALTPAFLVTIAIFFHSVQPIPWIKPAQDRIRRMHAQNNAFLELRNVILSQTNRPIFATTYQNTAQLRYAGVSAEQIPALGRASHFTLSAPDPCSFSTILVVQEITQPQLSCFSRNRLIATIPVSVRNVPIHAYYLWEYGT